jgi:hypothetical protein
MPAPINSDTAVPRTAQGHPSNRKISFRRLKMLEKYGKEAIESAKDYTTPFPVGLVPAVIADVQETVSNQGNEMLVVTYQSLEDPSAAVRDYITENEFTARKIKQIQTCFGIPYGAPAAGWTYKKGVVRTEEDVYNGFKKAKVKGYCKYNPELTYESYILRNDKGQAGPVDAAVRARVDARQEKSLQEQLDEVPF